MKVAAQAECSPREVAVGGPGCSEQATIHGIYSHRSPVWFSGLEQRKPDFTVPGWDEHKRWINCQHFMKADAILRLGTVRMNGIPRV